MCVTVDVMRMEQEDIWSESEDEGGEDVTGAGGNLYERHDDIVDVCTCRGNVPLVSFPCPFFSPHSSAMTHFVSLHPSNASPHSSAMTQFVSLHPSNRSLSLSAFSCWFVHVEYG